MLRSIARSAPACRSSLSNSDTDPAIYEAVGGGDGFWLEGAERRNYDRTLYPSPPSSRTKAS